MHVIMATICPKPLEIPPCFLASKLSLIIFIGFCGPVELLLVQSNVTQLVGLCVDWSAVAFTMLVSRDQTLTFFTCGRKSRVWSTYVELFVRLTQPAG